MRFNLENKARKNANLRHAEYYDMQSEFDALYQDSKDGKSFKNLMKLITSDNNIILAYRNIKRNTGSPTPGTDGITIKDIEKIETNEFLIMVKKRFNFYKPRKVRRVDIPKSNGKTRPLGIPSIWDRIAQQCILQVMEPICEAKFNRHSYGFRPFRSTEQAFADVSHRVNSSNMQYVVDIDIEGFFDNVSHTKLMRQIWSLGIQDKQLLVIIRRMLKAPIVMPDGKITYPTKGTPQGGVLSPLLANINLNEFDWWIANQWEERNLKEITPQYRKDGRRNRKNENVKLRKSTNLKEIYLVRYADDFKIFCQTRKEAVKTYHAAKLWLEERLKLTISSEKSRITNLKREPSEFLGFTFRMAQKGKRASGETKFVIRSNVSPKAIKRIHNQLRDQIKKIQKANRGYKALAEMNKYNSMVNGIHNYYRLASHVSRDFGTLGGHILITLYNRLNGLSKIGKYEGKHKGILAYMESSGVRYYRKYPILPISYVQHKSPMNAKVSINKYTKEGRLGIHKNQSIIPEWKLKWLRENPVVNNRVSIEFADNRISKFIAQGGKCAITGIELDLETMQCHHVNPYHKTKDDSYKNLVIVSYEVHALIHATNLGVIKKYLKALKLNDEQLDKLNKLRKKAGNDKI